MYWNSEHYWDPTAGEALDNVEREERQNPMTQREFYRSQAWRRARQSYIKYRESIDGGVCEVCHEELGLIVHHKIWLDDNNCNDPDISLNWDNFRYECLACHNKEQDPRKQNNKRIKYGPNGEIINNGKY